MRKVDERYQQKKQPPWIKSKESIEPHPLNAHLSNCPKSFLKGTETPVSFK